MKIHAFKLSFVGKGSDKAKFLASLKYIEELGLTDRVYEGNRIDQMSIGQKFIEIEFIKLRTSVLPGKATIATLSQSLGLGDDESISEEVCCLIDLENEVLILQYNKYGVKKIGIEQYFSAFMEKFIAYSGEKKTGVSGVVMTAILNPNMLSRFNKMKIFKKLDINLFIPPMNSIYQQDGVSLSDVVSIGAHGDAETANIILRAGRSRNDFLNPEYVRKMCKSVLDSVFDAKKLEVHGKEDFEAETEILDLLDAVLVHECNVEPGNDRRLPYFTRMSALKDVHLTWENSGFF